MRSDGYEVTKLTLNIISQYVQIANCTNTVVTCQLSQLKINKFIRNYLFPWCFSTPPRVKLSKNKNLRGITLRSLGTGHLLNKMPLFLSDMSLFSVGHNYSYAREDLNHSLFSIPYCQNMFQVIVKKKAWFLHEGPNMLSRRIAINMYSVAKLL